MAVVLVVVFAGIVAFLLQAAFKAFRIARQRRSGPGFGDLPLGAQVFFVVCVVVGLAGGVLFAASH